MDKVFYSQNKLSFELDKANLTATIVNSNEARGDILIPRSISYQSQEYIITKIDEKAFLGCSHLQSINFSKDSELRSIGKNAFFFSSISTLYIPSKLEMFEEDWCYKAQDLNTIYISDENPNFKYYDESNTIIIGKSNPRNSDFDLLVYVKYGVKELIIPSTIKRIVCNFSKNLISVKFEGKSSLEIIGKNLFPFFTDIYTIPYDLTIPSSVKFIGGLCSLPTKIFNNIISKENPNFKYIDDSMIIGKFNSESEEFDTIISARLDIKKAIIPSYIKHISQFAFSRCDDLTTVEFQSDSQLISIEKFAFNHSGIKEIKIPSSCQKIKKNAFFDCENLHAFELPDDSQLKKIPRRIFGKSVKSFTIPKSVEIIKPNWSMLEDYSNVNISPENHNYSFLNKDHNIIVGKSDPKSDAFDVIISACCNITEVFIPSNITRIESYAFFQCKKISSVQFDKDIQLKSIGRRAFGSTSIQTIDIPSSVVEIAEESFIFNMKLNTINIHEDSKLEIIGYEAFFISSITNIFIPAHVIKFPFDCIQSLDQVDLSPKNQYYKYLDEEKKIIIGKSDPKSSFDSIVFASKDITKALIPSTIKYINSYAFYDCNQLNEIKFEQNSQLISIGSHAFVQCNFAEITIPSHVQNIDEFCFENCFDLRKVEFEPNSEITCFDIYLFCNSGIESITIPSSIKELMPNWMINATNLKNIFLAPDNKYLKYSDESHKMILSRSNKNTDVFDVITYVDKNCHELTIPSNIKIIDADSFSYCHINEISIPKSVTQIRYQAFSNCITSSISFEEDSDLQLIEYGAFQSYYIKYLKLPKKIKYLDLNSFNDTDEWKFIELLSEEIYISNSNQNLANFFISFPNARKIHFNSVSDSIFYTLPNIELDFY